MRALLGGLALLCAILPVAAQHVTPHDIIPAFAANPTTITVADGGYCTPATWSTGQVPGPDDVAVIRHTLTYDCATSTVRTLGVDAGGTLRWSRTQSTVLQVGTLLALDGSTLDLGTVADPLPLGITTEVVFRDLPLDTTDDGQGVYDPSQYGTGLLCLGCTVTMYGAPASPFVRLTQEVPQGATVLHVTTVPPTWRVGDRLVLPDTRHLRAADLRPPLVQGAHTAPMRTASQTETVTLAAVEGTTLRLTAPTQYAHLGGTDPDGTLRHLPHVGHLTRHLVLRSERADGTRGHTLYTGRAHVDLRFAAFLHLGRTTADPLDNTSLPHIGTNQIGRYPVHIHHVPGRCDLPATQPQFVVQGVVVENGRKWGLTVHNSQYGLVADTIVYGTTGAGLVTEAGNEIRTVFRGNWALDSESGVRLTGPGETFLDPAGRKGNGFWFRGPDLDVLDNLASGNREGFGWYVGALETGPTSALAPVKIPTHKCADTSVPGESTTIALFRQPSGHWAGNEAYSSSEWGIGLWWFEQHGPPMQHVTAWHSTRAALRLHYVNMALEDVTLTNQGGLGAGLLQHNHFVSGRLPYRSSLTRFVARGFDHFYRRDGQLQMAPEWTFTAGTIQARVAFPLSPNGQGSGTSTWRFDDLRVVPLPGQVLRAFELTYPVLDANTREKILLITRYQGVLGDDFRLYWTQHPPASPCSTPRPEILGGYACLTGPGPCVPQCPAAIPCGETRPDGCEGTCSGPVCPPPPVTCAVPLSLLNALLAACPHEP